MDIERGVMRHVASTMLAHAAQPGQAGRNVALAGASLVAWL
jgi:hypothetical protein